MQRLGSACTWLLVLALIGGAAGSPPAPDPDVTKGIQQFEDGYYDQAALTLDAAIQRLAGNTSAAASLQQAYIYLGAACVGLGQGDRAKAQFRSAISLMVLQPGGKRGKIKDLSLLSFGFSPKIASAFEEAKREARGGAGEKDSGMSLPLVLGGVAVAGGGAVFLATRGHAEAPPAPPYNWLADQAIVFVGSDPPPGSTISVGSASSSSPKTVLRITLSAVVPESGLLRFYVADPKNCMDGKSEPLQVTAHQTMRAAAEVRYPFFLPPSGTPCPLPFTITSISAHVYDPVTLRIPVGPVSFPVSYTFVP